MATGKSIESLTWSETSYTLRTFLENFGLPNLVRIQEDHYGINEACTFDDDQVIMFHTLRYRKNLIGEDSAGRPIAIPLECENKFLVCPLLTYCRYDTIYVSQMSYVYPEIKYFRVLENNWNEVTKYLKPETILEIESINPETSAVKFVNIDQPLLSNCRVVFEPLLDFREYTLKDVVSVFGLPAKVTVLPDSNAQQNLEHEFENWISNLGNVTVACKEKRQAVIVATKIDTDLLGSDKSVKCLQIPTDFDLNVLVTTGLVRNDPAYLNTVRELNRAFLNKYDLKELDHNDKYEYLDRPSGNPTRIRDSVLVANEHAHNNPPELLPRLRCYNMTAPVVFPKPSTRPGSGVGECTLSKDTTRNLEKLGIYDDVKHSDLEENNFEYEKPQESMSDDSFDDSFDDSSDDCGDDFYEEIDDLEYEEVVDAIVTSPNHMSETSHDYEDTSSDEECYTASPGGHSAQGTRVKPAKTGSKVSRKAAILSALKLKFRSKRSHSETVDGYERNSRQQSVPIDLSAQRLKSDSTDSLGTTKTESKTENKLPIPVSKTKPTILSHSVSTHGNKALPVYPIPKVQPFPPFPQQQIAVSLRKTLSVSPTARVDPTLKPMASTPKPIPSSSKSAPSTPKLVPSTPEPIPSAPKSAPPTPKLVPSTPKPIPSSPKSALSTPKPVPLTPKPTFSVVLDQPVVPIGKALSDSSILSTQDFLHVPIPKDLASLSVEGVGRVLASLNMACYIDKFQEEQIDGEMLMALNESGLKSLDLKPFHVMKLVKVISGWRPNFDSKIA